LTAERALQLTAAAAAANFYTVLKKKQEVSLSRTQTNVL